MGPGGYSRRRRWDAKSTPTATPTPTADADANLTPAPTPCGSAWEERTPVPYHAGGIFAVSDGTYVYAGGGAAGDLTALSTTICSSMTQEPTPGRHWLHRQTRHALSQAVYFNGKIYNMGGWVSSSATSDSTRIYDTETQTWRTGARMPQALGGMATALWNGVIYVAGGYAVVSGWLTRSTPMTLPATPGAHWRQCHRH